MSTTPSSRAAGTRPGEARPLTGRRVLFYMLAFFGLIILVNGVMATVASRSFRGTVAENGYVESLRFAAFEKHGPAALAHERPPLEGPLPRTPASDGTTGAGRGGR
ncbi:FixH family protein [Marinibaculum pumilum]|uniref:FixH family protein n=1 Tax=Marinibaculum pumilum TaxID=1766165 RepID=A0ABV7KWF1_9PROT